MENSTNNDIGTMSEITQLAAAARAELKKFANTEVPKKSRYRAAKFGMLVVNLRPVVQWLPQRYISVPFTGAIIHIGGLERVHLLLAIARFDINGDGMIDNAEYELARQQGEKFVSNAVGGCANFAIISALLFGATHLSTIGRPKPFAASDEAVAKFGEATSTQVMWVVYTLNVLAQSLALGIIVLSIYSRQLLCNTLPSVMSKMAFLAETNLLSNMGAACTWMIASLVYVIVLGGFISVPSCARHCRCHAATLPRCHAVLLLLPLRAPPAAAPAPHPAPCLPTAPTRASSLCADGFVSTLIVPVIGCMVMVTMYPAFLNTAIRLHMEANMLIKHKQTHPRPGYISTPKPSSRVFR